MDQIPSRGEYIVEILLGMLYGKEVGISSCHLGRWLVGKLPLPILSGFWQNRWGHILWVPHKHQGGVEILLGMLRAKETGISYCHLGLWLLCAFTFTNVEWFDRTNHGGIFCEWHIYKTISACTSTLQHSIFWPLLQSSNIHAHNVRA